MAVENRAFIARAVTWAADQGVVQFADLGAGIPAPRPVHETAREANPQARVVYVDKNAEAARICEAMQLAERWEGTAVIEADLTDPGALADPALRAVINVGEPVCVVLGLVLGLMPARRARDVVAGYARLIAPGSCVVISSARVDDELTWKALRAACLTPR